MPRLLDQVARPNPPCRPRRRMSGGSAGSSSFKANAPRARGARPGSPRPCPAWPAGRTGRDKVTRRQHAAETAPQRVVRGAGIARPATCHGFATHLLEAAADIRTRQALLGPKGVAPTMIDTHVLDRGPGGVSPIDSPRSTPVGRVEGRSDQLWQIGD